MPNGTRRVGAHLSLNRNTFIASSTKKQTAEVMDIGRSGLHEATTFLLPRTAR